MTALAALQERLLSPYEIAAVHAGATSVRHGGEKQTFNNWDPYVNDGDRRCRPRSRSRATRTSTSSACGSTSCPPTAATRSRTGRAASASAQPTGLDVGPEADGPAARRPSGGSEHFEDDPAIDRLWKPGDSIQLAIGQKDRRDAASDGALLRADRERRQARHAARRRGREQPGENGAPLADAPAFAPAAAADPASTPARCRSSATASTRRRTTRTGRRPAIFGSFPVQIAGKTGTAEK